MPNEDYKNNPLYTDITNLDSLSPTPTFSYNWNSESGRWEPAGAVNIESIDISGDLNIDLGPTNEILNTLSSKTQGIHDLISLETNHILSGVTSGLSNIHETQVDNSRSTNNLLELINENLSGIQIDVSIDSDVETHRLLSGVSGELSNLDTEDIETHRLLSGISGELSNLDTEDIETHRLLSGVSGELSNLDTEDIETHRLLSGISGELSNLDTEDIETHRLLSGISGELSNLDTEDIEAHRLLSGISGELSDLDVEAIVDLSETNRLLSGISGELTELEVSLDSFETNRLLSGISGELTELEVSLDSFETNRLLSGISGELTELEVSLDSFETNRLLSGISGELAELEVSLDNSEGNRLLSGISGELSELDIEDQESHRLLSGISGELEKLNLGVDKENHRLLSGISGELVDIYQQIGRRELYQPWKLRTKTVSQKIDEDFILMENIPEELRYGIFSGECFGQDKHLMDDVFGNYFSNGRLNKSMLETGHPDYFIQSEYTDPNRCSQSYATFHSDTLFGLRQENVSASLINSYELNDINNLYERGLVDHVIIYNESPYPIQFHTAERRLNNSEPVSPKIDDIVYLESDMAVKIDSDEVGRIFIKRPHTISGFTVKYSIVYKETGLYDNFE
jgi:transcriptional regulator NrdR family protein